MNWIGLDQSETERPIGPRLDPLARKRDVGEAERERDSGACRLATRPSEHTVPVDVGIGRWA